MWDPNTPAEMHAPTTSGIDTPMLIAKGIMIGKAITYIPQLVPVMNSVHARIRKMSIGAVAGVITVDADSMHHLVKPICSFISANVNAMTISRSGRIMFWIPCMIMSQNSAADMIFCAIYNTNMKATVQSTPISILLSKNAVSKVNNEKRNTLFAERLLGKP